VSFSLRPFQSRVYDFVFSFFCKKLQKLDGSRAILASLSCSFDREVSCGIEVTTAVSVLFRLQTSFQSRPGLNSALPVIASLAVKGGAFWVF